MYLKSLPIKLPTTSGEKKKAEQVTDRVRATSQYGPAALQGQLERPRA